ncbi:hypothetical protein VCM_00054 [Pseudomonas phage VCM]|uniref:Uncharacterized protein n=1 Tax=Pseudomonas phage VCM TaxID=1729937 RepID=A0A0S4KW54_9CAUD|nr:hypothetical protein VCM_00054 [Pseudomonas phage VCM]CUR44273.1 hypothetical protein VCM_00054 [Pseudomonas phage VCM]
MTQQFKLSVEQATVAFDILDILQARFEETPELAVDVLKVILLGLESTLEEQ